MNDYSCIIKCFKTVIEMLQDRNYIIPEQILNLSPSEYRYMYNNNKYNFEVNNKNKKCFIIFFLNVNGNIKINTVREHINKLKYNDNDEFLIIIKNINNSIKKLEKEYNCNIFEINKLQFNLTKHSLVPKHILLKKEEVKEELKRYNIDNKLHLPFILESDAVCKWYNYKSGGIVKIVRNSITSGENYGLRYIK